MWRHVRHYHHRAAVPSPQFSRQPGHAFTVHFKRALGSEPDHPILAVAGAARGDVPVIVHAKRRQNARLRVPQQREIRPQRCSKETHAAYLDGLVLKQVDVRAGDFCPGFFPELAHGALTVELMVSHHVYNGSGEGLQGPFEAHQPDTDVAGEHGYVRIDFRQPEAAKLEMKIAENMDSHSSNRRLAPVYPGA